MTTFELKYDPSRPIMRELKDELNQLISAVEIHDSVLKSIIDRNQLLQYEDHLRNIIDSCDEMLYDAVDKFYKWKQNSLS